jgi:hypothetical protein
MRLKIELFFESQKLLVNLNLAGIKYISARDFIEYVMSKLNKKRLIKLSSNTKYGLFERLNGIEKLIEDQANVLKLRYFISNLKTPSEQNTHKIEYVIRKRQSFEKNKIGILSTSQKTKIKQFFKHKTDAKALHAVDHDCLIHKRQERYDFSIKIIYKDLKIMTTHDNSNILNEALIENDTEIESNHHQQINYVCHRKKYVYIEKKISSCF